MLYVKKIIRNSLNTLFTVLPAVLSLIAALKTSLLFLGLTVVSLFVAIWILPYVKRRENIWMFVLSAACFIPVNIQVVILVMTSFFFKDEPIVLSVLQGLLYYFILFSFEEILLGLITQRIWKRQHKIVA